MTCNISPEFIPPFPEDRERWLFPGKKRQLEKKSGRAIKRLARFPTAESEFKCIVYKELTFLAGFTQNQKTSEFNLYRLEGDSKNSALQVYIAGKKVKPVQLNAGISRRLAEIFVRGRPHPDFRCSDFVQYLMGNWKPEHLNTVDWREWGINKLQQGQKPTPGDSVCFTRKEINFSAIQEADEIRHMGIYLSSKLYISMIGANQIFITRLGHLHKLYDTTHVYVMKPQIKVVTV